jgi:hypothetical protein
MTTSTDVSGDASNREATPRGFEVLGSIVGSTRTWLA